MPQKLAKHETHIDLPGQKIKVFANTDVEVILRKHRDVIFHFEFAKSKTITVKVPGKSVPKSWMYDPKERKLSKEVSFPSGERHHVWIGREFEGDFEVLADGKLIGHFNPLKLDSGPIDPAPPFKPQPILIGYKEQAPSGPIACTPQDPFGSGVVINHNKSWYEGQLNYLPTLKDLSYLQYAPIAPAPPQDRAVVMLISGQHLQSHATSMAEGKEVQVPAQDLNLYVSQTQTESIFHAIMTSSIVTSDAFKTGSDYLRTNRHWLEVKSANLYLKKIKGQVMLVWKGRTDPSQLAHFTGSTYGLAHEKVSGVTGGYTLGKGKTVGATFRRVAIQTSEHALDAMKPLKAIKSVGVIVDVYGDWDSVYNDKKGSQQATEFLAKAGISLGAAGVSAAAGSAGMALLMLAMAAFIPVEVPAAVVFGIGLAVFWGASWLVSKGEDEAKKWVK